MNIIEHSDDSTIWNKFDMIADSLNYFPIEQIILDSIKFIVGGDISQEYDILGIDAYNNLLNTAKVINEVDTTLFRIDENTLIVFQGNSIEMTKEFEYSLIKLIAANEELPVANIGSSIRIFLFFTLNGWLLRYIIVGKVHFLPWR